MAVDEEETHPDRRALRSPCPTHGMQHGFYTADDDGKRVELLCAQKGCEFREIYEVRWPQAFRARPEAQADGQP